MLRTASSLPPCRASDAGLRPGPFPDRAASLLPGLLAATRTGLTPAGDDELTNTKISYIKSQPLLPSCWTHSTPCTDCSSGRIRNQRWTDHPLPAHPYSPSPPGKPPRPPTSRYQTVCLATSACPSNSSQTGVWLIERTQPRITLPLGSTPITGVSQLLRTGPPPHPHNGTQSLTVSAA